MDALVSLSLSLFLSHLTELSIEKANSMVVAAAAVFSVYSKKKIHSRTIRN